MARRQSDPRTAVSTASGLVAEGRGSRQLEAAAVIVQRQWGRYVSWNLQMLSASHLPMLQMQLAVAEQLALPMGGPKCHQRIPLVWQRRFRQHLERLSALARASIVEAVGGVARELRLYRIGARLPQNKKRDPRVGGPMFAKGRRRAPLCPHPCTLR